MNKPIRMTAEQFEAATEKLRSKTPGSPQDKPEPEEQRVGRRWYQNPLAWLLVAFLLAALNDVATGKRQLEALSQRVAQVESIQADLEARLELVERQVQAAAEDALLQRVEQDLSTTRVAIGEPALAVRVELPNEPEDATEWLSRGLIGLGATADCSGECLLYVDAVGTVVEFRFDP